MRKDGLTDVQGGGFSEKHLAAFLQCNLGFPPRRRKDMMFIPCVSPPRSSECITANSSSRDTLSKSPVIVLEADGTTTTYLIAQAKHPGVILDSFSSSPPTTILPPKYIHLYHLYCHHPCFLTTLPAAILTTLTSHWPHRGQGDFFF